MEELVRHMAPGSPPGDECPDELDLAALAEGRLDEAERGPLEEHVAACEACRGVLALLAEGSSTVAAVEPARPGPRLLRPLLAAALVIALFAVAVGPRWKRGRVSMDERLVAAATLLATERPELFSEFAPLGRDERRSPESGAVRGGLIALAPIGPVLSPRPRFRWEPVAGSASYAVRVETSSGEAVWSATSTRPELMFPSDEEDLDAGPYLWEVVATGPAGEERVSAAFEVVTDEQRAAFREAERAMYQLVESDVSRLLRAHYAMRLGMWGEAEVAVRAHLDGVPGDLAARETLYNLLTGLGASEAAEYRPQGE